jgi:hypothetical protein
MQFAGRLQNIVLDSIKELGKIHIDALARHSFVQPHLPAGKGANP